VQLPAPIWSAAPPPPASPNPAPIVAAVVNAPEPDLGQQLGNAEWVKVFVTESPNAAALSHLVTGDKAVPNKVTETETEWSLVQAGAGGGLPSDLTESHQMGKGSESVMRRFEFFKYTGAYDSGSHEALPVNDAAPSAGELGSLIGVQMGALNLAKKGVIPGDHTAPKVIVDSKPTSTTKSTSARFAFHAIDPDNKMGFTYFCSLDGRIPSMCTSARLFTKLSKGKHSFKIYAADVARNASKAVTNTWIIK